MERRNVALLVAAGVCLLVLAQPLYAFPHANQSVYSFEIENMTASPPSGAAIAYDSLPEGAHAVVDEARRSDHNSSTVYGPSEAKAALEGHDYVRQGDAYYTYEIRGKDIARGSSLLFRDLISGLAGGVLAVSVRAWWRREYPVRTLRYGLIAIGGAIGGAYTVQVHDAVLTPATLGLWPPRIIISGVLLTALISLWVTAGLIDRHIIPGE